MSLSASRQRQKTDIRSRILHSAWGLVKQDGWQALSIRKIADAIGYSIPVIYDHFENKEAILYEFAREGFELLSKKIFAAKNKYPDPTQRLEAMTGAYWRFASKNQEYYQLMYGLGMPSCEVEKDITDCVCYDSLLLDTIREILVKNKRPAADATLKYFSLLSILHGLIAINRMKNSPASDSMNLLILKDAVGGFILGLKK